MTYEDAFAQAVALNAESRELVRVYRLEGSHAVTYWPTQCIAAPYSSAVLVGEVRRMCPR